MEVKKRGVAALIIMVALVLSLTGCARAAPTPTPIGSLGDYWATVSYTPGVSPTPTPTRTPSPSPTPTVLIPLPPNVYDFFPDNNSEGVSVTPSIVVYFTRPQSFDLKLEPEVQIASVEQERVGVASAKYTIILAKPLEPATTYTATVTIRQGTPPPGFAPAPPVSWQFTTETSTTAMPTASPTSTPTPWPESAGIHTPEDLRSFLATWPEDLQLAINEDVTVKYCTPECGGFIVFPAIIFHIPSMSNVHLGFEAEVVMRNYESEEGKTALEEVLANTALMDQIKDRIDALFEGHRPPTPTPMPCASQYPEDPATVDDWTEWLDQAQDELKLWLRDDVVAWFPKPCGSSSDGYPVFLVHLPSQSSVRYEPRGFGGYENSAYLKDYRTGEAGSLLDDLLRDEDIETTIRYHLGWLEGLVWAESDRAVPVEDAVDVMFQAAKRLLDEHNYGDDTCVLVHDGWKVGATEMEPMDTGLGEQVAKRLKGRTTYEAFVAEESLVENQCPRPDLLGPVHVYFDRIAAWDDKIQVSVRAGCGLNCWGNGGASYIYVKDNGNWEWYATAGAWMD